MSESTGEEPELTPEEIRSMAEVDRRLDEWMDRWKDLRKRAPWGISVDVTTNGTQDFKYVSASPGTILQISVHPTVTDNPSVSYPWPIILLSDEINFDAPLEDLQDAVRMAALLSPPVDNDWYRHGLRYITYRFLETFELLFGLNQVYGLRDFPKSIFLDGPDGYWRVISSLLMDDTGEFEIRRVSSAPLLNLSQFNDFWFNLGIKGIRPRPKTPLGIPGLLSYCSLPAEVLLPKIPLRGSTEIIWESADENEYEWDFSLYIGDAYRSHEFFLDSLAESYRSEASRISAPKLKIPEGSTFEDITIRPAEPWPKAVEVFMPGNQQPTKFTYHDFRAVDQRTGKPNMVWDCFLRTIDQPELREEEGIRLILDNSPWSSDQARFKAKWLKSQIKTMLCSFFGTPEDPFHKYRRRRDHYSYGWYLKMRIHPDN